MQCTSTYTGVVITTTTRQLTSVYLAQVHHDTLMYFLPQMSSEDLDQRDLECWDLAVHEDASQVQLDLEPDVDVGTVDRRRPPQREATVWDLVQTRALCVGQLLVLHRLLKATGLLPTSDTSLAFSLCE